MALSNFVQGKKPRGPRPEPVVAPDRPSHAPMFTSEHGEQPNAVGGEILGQPEVAPRAVPSRTRSEAHAKGCDPEALGVTGEEIEG
jgi:hypothetical protein